MIDHITLRVDDFDASLRFYDTVLGALGHTRGATDHATPFVEWGDFSMILRSDEIPAARNVHVAFAASSAAQVDAFWQAGVDAGYHSNGEPGERPQYHVGYYGAFLLDPDGNNVEAVFHGP